MAHDNTKPSIVPWDDRCPQVLIAGAIVMVEPKGDLPEDINPYGFKIKDLETYRKLRQPGVNVTIFKKGTLGMFLEHGTWTDGIILVDEAIYAIPYQFLRVILSSLKEEETE